MNRVASDESTIPEKRVVRRGGGGGGEGEGSGTDQRGHQGV